MLRIQLYRSATWFRHIRRKNHSNKRLYDRMITCVHVITKREQTLSLAITRWNKCISSPAPKYEQGRYKNSHLSHWSTDRECQQSGPLTCSDKKCVHYKHVLIKKKNVISSKMQNHTQNIIPSNFPLSLNTISNTVESESRSYYWEDFSSSRFSLQNYWHNNQFLWKLQ